jgi:hypothetical protein
MRNIINRFIFLCPLLALSCEKVAPKLRAVTPPNNYFSESYDVTSLAISPSFMTADSVGFVKDLALEEISGIAASHAVPGALWAEEDSGNENNLYLLSECGNTLANFRMTSISNRDWEDLAVANGPIAGIRYLYLAETGDNYFRYASKFIYRFPEPAPPAQGFAAFNEILSVDRIEFTYPDGIKNAEAVMVDPVTRDIYVISKENQATIYVARYPQPVNSAFVITKLGMLPISDVTAADISPDGNEILIKNYSQLFYWKKTSTETITDLLQQTPKRAPYIPETKGESIAWAPDGSGYLVTSEGENQPLYFYKRK